MQVFFANGSSFRSSGSIIIPRYAAKRRHRTLICPGCSNVFRSGTSGSGTRGAVSRVGGCNSPEPHGYRKWMGAIILQHNVINDHAPTDFTAKKSAVSNTTAACRNQMTRLTAMATVEQYFLKKHYRTPGVQEATVAKTTSGGASCGGRFVDVSQKNVF